MSMKPFLVLVQFLDDPKIWTTKAVTDISTVTAESLIAAMFRGHRRPARIFNLYFIDTDGSRLFCGDTNEKINVPLQTALHRISQGGNPSRRLADDKNSKPGIIFQVESFSTFSSMTVLAPKLNSPITKSSTVKTKSTLKKKRIKVPRFLDKNAQRSHFVDQNGNFLSSSEQVPMLQSRLKTVSVANGLAFLSEKRYETFLFHSPNPEYPKGRVECKNCKESWIPGGVGLISNFKRFNDRLSKHTEKCGKHVRKEVKMKTLSHYFTRKRKE